MKIESLFTRSAAETPKKMEVKTFDGIETGVYMQVLGSESTVFLNAKRAFLRRQLLTADEAKALNLDAAHSSEMELAMLVSCLVVDWDFEEECTEPNKTRLFYESPYLAEQVEQFAISRGNRIEAEKEDS